MPLPEVMPAFGRLRVDDEGNVWVEEYRVTSTDPSHWMIFGPEGLLKAELDWPAGVEPHHIGSDFVLGVWTDELEVEYVGLYGITKP
jgi:hypothetical protein